MNMPENKLTVEEIEQLCQLYMDCQLTVFEETELEYVLSRLPYSTQCIEDTRALMQISISTNNKSSSANISKKSLYNTIIGIAASIAIFLAVGIMLIGKNTVSEPTEGPLYIAYANGHQLNPEQSIQMVKSDLQRAEAFLNHIAELEAQEQIKMNEFLTQIPFDK